MDMLGLLKATQTHKYFPTRDVTLTAFLRKKIIMQFACVLEVFATSSAINPLLKALLLFQIILNYLAM